MRTVAKRDTCRLKEMSRVSHHLPVCGLGDELATAPQNLAQHMEGKYEQNAWEEGRAERTGFRVATCSSCWRICHCELIHILGEDR